MAIGLPDLVVGLGLDTKKFSAGLSSAQKMMGGFASAAKSAILPLTAAFAAATGGAYLLQGRISKLAGVADQAVRTGLSGEFLQQLEYAADQSGVSVETLTGSIKKLTVTIGQNKKGFEDLQGLSPEKAFLEVARRISEIPTASGRAAASMKYFGRAGADMATLFAGGMNDVNKLLAEAKGLGIGLSDEALKKAADADDSVQRMYASFGALFDQVAIGVAPVFDDIATYIADWIPPITEFMNKFNELPNKFEWAGNALVAAFDVAFETMKAHFAQAIVAMFEMKDALFRAPLDELQASGRELGEQFAVAVGLAERNVGIGGEAKAGGLQAAQQRFAGVMGQLNRGGAEADLQRWQNMPSESDAAFKARTAGMKLKDKAGGSGDIGGLLSSFGDALTGPVAELKTKLQQKGAELELQANWWGSVITQMFTGERPKEEAKPQQSLRLAGAMSRGSAEAYSVIANAMARSRDPVVNATEKSADKIVKAIKEKPTFWMNVLESFDS